MINKTLCISTKFNLVNYGKFRTSNNMTIDILSQDKNFEF